MNSSPPEVKDPSVLSFSNTLSQGPEWRQQGDQVGFRMVIPHQWNKSKTLCSGNKTSTSAFGPSPPSQISLQSFWPDPQSQQQSNLCLGEGNGNPLQYSCLENPRDRGAWWAAVYGVAQSRTRLKRLSSSSRTLASAPFPLEENCSESL